MEIFRFAGIPTQEPMEKGVSFRAKLLLRSGFRRVAQEKIDLYGSIVLSAIAALGAVLFKDQHIKDGCAAAAIVGTGLAIAHAKGLNDAISDLHRRVHSFNIS